MIHQSKPRPSKHRYKLFFCYFLPFSGVISSENRPFQSSLVLLFQSESKCETVLTKMTLIWMKMKLHAELIFI